MTTDSCPWQSVPSSSQYFDEESGLYYNYHRYYDPEHGSYITADPIGLNGGINQFSYTTNDPVNKIDPLGLDEHFGQLCSDGCCSCGTAEYVSVPKTITSKYVPEYFDSVIEDSQNRQTAAMAKFLYKVRKNPIGKNKRIPIPPKPNIVIIGISRMHNLVQPMKCWREVCANNGDVYYNGCDADGDSEWIINLSAPTKDIERTYFW